MAMKNRTILGVTTAALGALAGASFPPPAALLQFDVNGVTTTVSNPDLSTPYYNGTVFFSANSNSTLAGILINGVAQTVTGTLSDFYGEIRIIRGRVGRGGFTLKVLESDGVTINSYTADLTSGQGSIGTHDGRGYTIDGYTLGDFSSSTFAGVDIGAWAGTVPSRGSFNLFAFNPDAMGVDTQTDINLYVTLPLPAGGAMAFVGLAGLAGVRRRSC